MRAKSSGGWLISNFSESPIRKLSHVDLICPQPKILVTTLQMQFNTAANYDDALLKAADECGIDREYWDILHQRHEPTSDVRRKILESLGFDVGSKESLDAQRLRQLAGNAASALRKTPAITVSEQVLPLPLQADLPAPVEFEIALESREHLRGSLETAQLPVIQQSMA